MTSPGRGLAGGAGAGVVVLAAATGPTATTTTGARRKAMGHPAGQPGPARGDTSATRSARSAHPHVGTMVENRAEVERVLAGSTIPLCLDTGHLLIGGTDPLELARQVPDRIAHAHLKDVDAALAAKVQSGELSYTEAVGAGMYAPLGAGDVDIAGIVKMLEDNGYEAGTSWSRTTSSTANPRGEGPLADVRASVAFLHGSHARP